MDCVVHNQIYHVGTPARLRTKARLALVLVLFLLIEALCVPRSTRKIRFTYDYE